MMKSLILKTLDNFLSARPHWQIVLCGVVLIALVGMLDYITGLEISFSVFYLIPIVFTSWYAQRRWGLSMCVLSAATWLAVDITSGQAYSQAWILVWNAVVRLAFFFVTAYLIAEIKMYLRTEQLLARTDSLTGLRNARALREDGDLFFRDARRHQYPISIGFIDLDGFKGVNDTSGHAEGDRVLKAIGVALPRLVRESDIVARFGGDEFVVILPHTEMSDAKIVFDKMLRGLTEEMKVGAWPVGFSFGVAVFANRMPHFSEALELADGLMYRVKQSSRNSLIYETY